jgi:hypothetical protein
MLLCMSAASSFGFAACAPVWESRTRRWLCRGRPANHLPRQTTMTSRLVEYFGKACPCETFLNAGPTFAEKILLDPGRPLFRLSPELILGLLQIRATSIESKAIRGGRIERD